MLMRHLHVMVRSVSLVLGLLILINTMAVHSAVAESRIAMVVGNGNYDAVIDLDNSANDARAIAGQLRELGFEVLEQIDYSEEQLEQALRTFSLKSAHADVALFYYAGHAIQYEGENYIVPTDAVLETVSDIDRQLIRLGTILKEIQAQADMSLIFLDACRNNPFADLSGVTRATPKQGLSPLKAEHNSFVAFATEPGNVAYDSVGGHHSPFTGALLRHIRSPGLEINHIMNRVRDEVLRVTEGKQVPWDQSSLLREFYFNPGEEEDGVELQVELAKLNDILRIKDVTVQLQRLRAFSKDYPESSLLGVAESTIASLLESGRKLDNQRFATEDNQPPVLAAIPDLVVEAGEVGQPLPITPPRDPDRDELEIEVQEVPSNGTLRYLGRQIKVGDLLTVGELEDGTYHPPYDITGPAGQFTFRVHDGRGGATIGAMKVRILDPNNPPVFNPPRLLVATIGADPVVLDEVLPTDPDPNDNVLVEIRTMPSKGRLNLSDGPVKPGQLVTAKQYTDILYEPPDEFSPGVERIELAAGDGRKETIRNIEIRLNRPPSFGQDMVVRVLSNGEAEPLTLDPPIDEDGDRLKIVVNAVPRGVHLLFRERILQPGDQLTSDELINLALMPETGFTGFAGSLRLEAVDGVGGRDLKTIDVKVDRPNTPPVLRKPERRLLIVADQLTPLNLSSPFDRDGDALTITITELSKGGRLLVNERELHEDDVLTIGELLNLGVIAHPDIVDQTLTIAYTVDDQRGGQAVGHIEAIVEAPNTLPVAPHQGLLSFRADEAPIKLLRDQRPHDPDGDPLTVSILDVPTAGAILIGKRRINRGDTLSVDDLMRVAYMPPKGFSGFAGLFRYLIRDSRGGTARGYLEKVVKPANRPPQAARIAMLEIEAGGDQKPLSILPPYDPDDDLLEIEIVEFSNMPGTKLTLDGRDLARGDVLNVSDLIRIEIEASLEAVGTTGVLRFEVRDDKGGKAVTGKDIIVIEPPNRAPVIRLPAKIEMARGSGPQPLGLLEPSDPEGDPLTIRLTALPAEGTIQLRGDALETGAEIRPSDLPDLMYDPGDRMSGVIVWLSFSVIDGRQAEAAGNVPIRIIIPPNRPPVLAGQPVVDAVVGVGPIPLPIEPPVDPDRDQLTIKITSLPEHGRLTFGRRKAFEGMELSIDAFVDARFTPALPTDNRQAAVREALTRNVSTSSLRYVADDGRGGTSDGEIEIRIVFHACDQLASTPGHADRVAAPIDFESIDAKPAIEACKSALADYGNIVRFRVQLARALHAAGDYLKAKNTYFEATNAGDPVAQHNLAILILDPPPGLDIEEDERAFAIRLLSMASDAGLTAAQKHLAQILWDTDREQALHWLDLASQQEDPEAMTQLAMAYAQDDGADPDVDRIIDLLERAHALGHIEAATNLGYVYGAGLDGGANFERAIGWFEKAVEHGDKKAAINLGHFYHRGLGTSPRPIDAIKLYADVACSEPIDDELRALAIDYLDDMPANDRTRAVQAALRRQGYDGGAGDDDLEAATRHALELYQSAKGIAKQPLESTSTLLSLWGCQDPQVSLD